MAIGIRAVREPSQQFVRFVVVGGSNTVVTYALLLALDVLLPLTLAYSVAFATGLFLITWLNRTFVFRAQGGASTTLRFTGGYLVVYLIGRALLIVFTSVDVPPRLAAGAVVALTAPLGFLVGRWAFPVPRQGSTVQLETERSGTQT